MRREHFLDGTCWHWKIINWFEKNFRLNAFFHSDSRFQINFEYETFPRKASIRCCIFFFPSSSWLNSSCAFEYDNRSNVDYSFYPCGASQLNWPKQYQIVINVNSSTQHYYYSIWIVMVTWTLLNCFVWQTKVLFKNVNIFSFKGIIRSISDDFSAWIFIFHWFR